MEIDKKGGNICKQMEINENDWIQMEIDENRWKQIEIMEID